jgi:hypothetical protein
MQINQMQCSWRIIFTKSLAFIANRSFLCTRRICRPQFLTPNGIALLGLPLRAPGAITGRFIVLP